MVSRDTCFFTLAIVSGFLIVSMDARSWDMAVAIGNQIDFFDRNGNRTANATLANTGKLTALAYDSASSTMYMSDGSSHLPYMYAANMIDDKLSAEPLLSRNETERISAMVFDPKTKTLFWIDSTLELLMKMRVGPSDTKHSPEVVHDLTGSLPHGIAIDICHGYIYWANSHSAIHSIERSKLDGSDRKLIRNDTLFEVYALAVDHVSGKLYFADSNRINQRYTIEEMNFDGSNKRVLVNGTHQMPVYLAVDERTVYWTDGESDSIWKVDKNGAAKESEMIPYRNTHPGMLPMSIITRYNAGDIDCKAILEREQNEAKNIESTTTSATSIITPQTSEKYVIDDEHQEKNSTNTLNFNSTTLRNCEEGSTDCGTLACLNFCVHGECTIDDNGSPQCKCGTKYTGKRCEKDICDGYCLNNGSCSVNEEGRPTCKCENSRGSQCQYNVEIVDKLCVLYCLRTDDRMNSFSATICRCSELNETSSDTYDDSDSLVSSTILLSILIAFIAALAIVVGVLSYHVNKLKRRPRIRKRFVVSKGGVTPLTSRPQLPTDSCEITIENCCNMNICETPCFEPKLRATPTKSKKGEEKSSLLDSMEGADSC